jgi:aquaporin Z
MRPKASHLAEYAIEGVLLGLFLVSASGVTVVLEHPASPVRAVVPDARVRRVLGGVAMGLTAIGLIYSRPGRRSGAHMNPAVTLTFLRLGKIAPADAVGYVAGQVAGALGTMLTLSAVAGAWLANPAVNYVRTVPGPAGAGVALAAEAAISCGMMLLVLTVSNSRWRAITGVCAGVLVAIYISVEAPLSGMSMNPARTFGPAAASGTFTALWIYFVAPLAGMFAAAEIYVRRRGLAAVACAKLHHDTRSRCIFRCRFRAQASERGSRGSGIGHGISPTPETRAGVVDARFDRLRRGLRRVRRSVRAKAERHRRHNDHRSPLRPPRGGEAVR